MTAVNCTSFGTVQETKSVTTFGLAATFPHCCALFKQELFRCYDFPERKKKPKAIMQSVMDRTFYASAGYFYFG